MTPGADFACSEVLDRVAAWLDGELGASEAELFARHLEGCASCTAEVARLERQHFDRRGPPDTTAPGFWDRLDAAVVAELDVCDGWARPGSAVAGGPEVAGGAPAGVGVDRRARWQMRALVALLVASTGLAAIQTVRVEAARAEVAALEDALRHRAQADAQPTTAMPVEPVTVAVSGPYRGSL